MLKYYNYKWIFLIKYYVIGFNLWLINFIFFFNIDVMNLIKINYQKILINSFKNINFKRLYFFNNLNFTEKSFENTVFFNQIKNKNYKISVKYIFIKNNIKKNIFIKKNLKFSKLSDTRYIKNNNKTSIYKKSFYKIWFKFFKNLNFKQFNLFKKKKYNFYFYKFIGSKKFKYTIKQKNIKKGNKFFSGSYYSEALMYIKKKLEQKKTKTMNYYNLLNARIKLIKILKKFKENKNSEFLRKKNNYKLTIINFLIKNKIYKKKLNINFFIKKNKYKFFSKIKFIKKISKKTKIYYNFKKEFIKFNKYFKPKYYFRKNYKISKNTKILVEKNLKNLYKKNYSNIPFNCCPPILLLSSYKLFFNTILFYPFLISNYCNFLSNINFTNYISKFWLKKVVLRPDDHFYEMTEYYTKLGFFLEKQTSKNICIYISINNFNEITPFFEVLLSSWHWKIKHFYYIFKRQFDVRIILKLLFLIVKNKDIHLLAKIITIIMPKIEFKKHRKFFKFIFQMFKSFLLVLYPVFKIQGFHFEFRGKISVDGNSRTRKMYAKIQRPSPSNYSYSTKYVYKTVNTFTGVLGLKIWIYYSI